MDTTIIFNHAVLLIAYHTYMYSNGIHNSIQHKKLAFYAYYPTSNFNHSQNAAIHFILNKRRLKKKKLTVIYTHILIQKWVAALTQMAL